MDYMHTSLPPPVHNGFVPSENLASAPPSNSSSERTWNPGGWNKGLRMPVLPPNDEFNELYAAALNAFIDIEANGPDTVLDLIQRAIAVNPEVYQAHSLLSEIYKFMGDDEKALLTLFTGAHAAPRDPEIWKSFAESCLQMASLDEESRLERLDKVNYAYTKILNVNPADDEARFQRAATNRELGHHGKALKDLDTILQHMPHNPSVLRLLSQMCIDIKQIPRAKQKYEECIEYSKAFNLPGEPPFTWDDIVYYVELFAVDGEYDEAIFRLKQLARWLAGRHEEIFWDYCEDDDREWDAEHQPRREMIEHFESGRFPNELYGDALLLDIRVRLGTYRLKQGRSSLKEALSHFDWLDPEDEESDAKVYDYPDLFLEAAKALTKANEHQEALRYLEALKRTNALNDATAWMTIGESYYVCNKRDQAIESYEIAKSLDDECSEARFQLSKLYKDLGDRRRAVQNAEEAAILRQQPPRPTMRRQYERKDQRIAREAAERALKEARKLPGPKKAAVAHVPHPTFDFDSSQTQWQLHGNTLTLHPQPNERRRFRRREKLERTQKEIETLETEKILQDYSTLVHETPSMRNGDPQAITKWIVCAENLVSEFRSNKVFYPHERHITFQGYDKDARTSTFRKKWKKDKSQTPQLTHSPTSSISDSDIPFPSIENSIPTSYRSILFTSWLDIFLESALLYAKHARSKTDCYRTINAALDCTVWYHNPESMLHIYIVYFACALTLKDANTLFNVVARWFMRQYQFCTDTYRLFAALNLIYEYPCTHGGKDAQMHDAPFRLGPSQKFVFRQVKAVDALLPLDYDGGLEGPVPRFMREELGRMAKEEAEDEQKRAVGGFPGFKERSVRPRQMDVVLLTLYGHILYAAGSYPNALSYFYRARSLDPKNPVVLLSMALSYTHQMFKRQNEDRHAFLLRGLAFFQEYADARIEWAQRSDGDKLDNGKGELEKVVRQEIEFNRARMWQMLGMADLALRGYEKTLGMSLGNPDAVVDGDAATSVVDGVQSEDWSMEAAYAMQLIYAVNGDAEMAKRVTERYLVVE